MNISCLNLAAGSGALMLALSCSERVDAVFAPAGDRDATAAFDASMDDAGPSPVDASSDRSDSQPLKDAADSPVACVPQVSSPAKGQVDIVFVIDNSSTMNDEMTQIKAHLNNFASKMGSNGFDYRVIVIAAKGTGVLQLCVPQPLAAPNCADNPPVFHHVSLSVQSSDALSVLLSTYDTTWKNYVRADSFKVFIAVSNDNAAAPYVTANTFEQQLFAKVPTGIFGDATRRKYMFDSICGWAENTPYQSSAPCATAVSPGLEYQTLSFTTGGAIASVCNTDYTTTFNQFATSIKQRIGCEYFPKTGDGGTVDPNQLAVTYTRSGNTVATTLLRVTDSSKCAANPTGWYYDASLTPVRIVLCAAECATVLADANGTVNVETGCAQPAPL